MWKVAVATAVLLLAVGFAHVSGRAEPRAKVSLISGSGCGKAVIRDWFQNARIDGAYERRCYELALASLPDSGIASLEADLESRLNG